MAATPPEKIPALSARGASINRGKESAKTPQPLPKNVIQVQTQSGAKRVTVLIARKVLCCDSVKYSAAPMPMGITGMHQATQEKRVAMIRLARSIGSVQLDFYLRKNIGHRNGLHADIILARCFTVIGSTDAG